MNTLIFFPTFEVPYRLGVNSYTQKPIDFNQFQTTIRDLGYYWLVVNQSLPPDAFPPS